MQKTQTARPSAFARSTTAIIAMMTMLFASVCLPAAASITNTRADAQGTVELAGANWLDGMGVPVYSNGNSSGNDAGRNTVNNIYTGQKWQCVELINRLYVSRGWITNTWWGNGNQVYANAPSNLSKEANGSITYLNPGDVVALDDGGFGHAGIVNSVSGSTVQIVNQNTTAVYSMATYSNKRLTMSGWAGYTIQGVIHRPGTTAPPTPPAPTGVGTRMMGDVNGDGRSDAVVMFKDTGTAMVALATTNETFGTPQSWASGHSVNREYYLADVNGDKKADLVAYTAGGSYWDVSLSSGSGFWAPTQWASNQGAGSTKRFVTDVTGDKMADVVYFVASSGNWYVDASSGSGFWGPPKLWSSGNGVGSSNQQVADFNGDGKADVGVYFDVSGNWYVGLSTGSAFGYPGQWSAGHGQGTAFQLTGDVTGDKKADVVYYSSNIFRWWTGASSGSGFWSLAEWSYDGPDWRTFANAFVADVNGDGRADKVLYYNDSGQWYVSTSAGSGWWPLHLAVDGHGKNS